MAPKFLQKSFKARECKTSLKLAVCRIKLLKNKGEAQLKLMKKDLALLLKSGQEQTARIRVEDLVREEKTMAAYGIITIYCELIVAHFAEIDSQKNCPIDLKEAIASVIFASPRCSDIPELQDARKHFEVKYGKIFTTAALELRPDCGVHRTMIQKLSVKTPDGETKIKILTAIAREHNVKWDPAVLKEQLSEPHEDLVNGPNKFVSNNQIPWGSNNSQFQPPEGHNHEAAAKYSCNDAARSSSSSRTSSTSMSIPVASIPMTSHTESRTSENKAGEEDFRNPFWDETPPLNRQNWDVKFADATAAAQAAAESAERATIAARAAAELSSRGKFTREFSTDPHKSPSYGCTESRYGDYGSAKSRATGSFSSDSCVTSIDGNMAMHNPEKVRGFSQKNSFEGEVDLNWQRKAAERGVYHGKGSFKNEFSPSAPFCVSKGSSDDDISIINLQKENSYPRKGFTEVESVYQNQWNMQTERNGLGVRNIRKNNLTTDQNIHITGNGGYRSSMLSSRARTSSQLETTMSEAPVTSDFVVGRGMSQMSSSSDSDDSEVQGHQCRGYHGSLLSHRGKDSLSLSQKHSLSWNNGRSEAPVSPEFSARSRLSQLSSSMGESLSKHQNLTSESRENSESSLPDSSIKHKSSKPPQCIEISVPKESVQLTQSASVAKLAPKPLPKVVASGSNENPKSASLTQSSTSRENSLKIPSHVHPKLPDYDTLVAQLKSLRSS